MNYNKKLFDKQNLLFFLVSKETVDMKLNSGNKVEVQEVKTGNSVVLQVKLKYYLKSNNT